MRFTINKVTFKCTTQNRIRPKRFSAKNSTKYGQKNRFKLFWRFLNNRKVLHCLHKSTSRRYQTLPTLQPRFCQARTTSLSQLRHVLNQFIQNKSCFKNVCWCKIWFKREECPNALQHYTKQSQLWLSVYSLATSPMPYMHVFIASC